MGDLINLRNSKPEWSIKNATTTEAEIIIYGSIGEDFWDEDAITAKRFSEELAKLPSSVKTINLRINSPGGDVFDGITIYERLKQHKAKVITYIDGIAASIASIIALAGDEIRIGEGAMIMVHRPMAGMFGNAGELERMIDILDKIEDQMTSIYMRKTGLTYLEVDKLLKGDAGEGTWLTSDEALENGFVKEIIGKTDGLSLAASLVDKASWIKHKPTMKAKNAEVKTKLKNFKKDIEDFLAR